LVERTADGLITPLAPSPRTLAAGALVIVVGVLAAVVVRWWLAIPFVLAGVVAVIDGSGGKRRLRVTASKLLIEDERPILGLLVGPLRSRVAWSELTDVRVDDRGGAPVLIVASAAGPLELGRGAPRDELERVAVRIRDSVAQPSVI
jgi:hypothetical protein